MFFQLFLPIGHLGFSSLHCGICSGLFHECLFQRRLGLGQFACQVLYMGPVHDHVLFHVLQGAGCFFVLFLLAGLQFTTVLNRLFEPCYITADGIKLALHRIVCFAGNRLFLVGRLHQGLCGSLFGELFLHRSFLHRQTGKAKLSIVLKGQPLQGQQI